MLPRHAGGVADDMAIGPDHGYSWSKTAGFEADRDLIAGGARKGVAFCLIAAEQTRRGIKDVRNGRAIIDDP